MKMTTKYTWIFAISLACFVYSLANSQDVLQKTSVTTDQEEDEADENVNSDIATEEGTSQGDLLLYEDSVGEEDTLMDQMVRLSEKIKDKDTAEMEQEPQDPTSKKVLKEQEVWQAIDTTFAEPVQQQQEIVNQQLTQRANERKLHVQEENIDKQHQSSHKTEERQHTQQVVQRVVNDDTPVSFQSVEHHTDVDKDYKTVTEQMKDYENKILEQYESSLDLGDDDDKNVFPDDDIDVGDEGVNVNHDNDDIVDYMGKSDHELHQGRTGHIVPTETVLTSTNLQPPRTEQKLNIAASKDLNTAEKQIVKATPAVQNKKAESEPSMTTQDKTVEILRMSIVHASVDKSTTSSSMDNGEKHIPVGISSSESHSKPIIEPVKETPHMDKMISVTTKDVLISDNFIEISEETTELQLDSVTDSVSFTKTEVPQITASPDQFASQSLSPSTPQIEPSHNIAKSESVTAATAHQTQVKKKLTDGKLSEDQQGSEYKPTHVLKSTPPTIILGQAHIYYEEGEKLINSSYRKDYIQAYEYFKLAGELGSPKALEHLGFGHLLGDYIEHNPVRALKIFTDLSDTGSPRGQLGLGFVYSSGLAVNSSQAKALIYFTFAALGGDPLAQMVLGYRYFHGIGVETRCETALQFYRKVATTVANNVNTGSPVVQRVRLQDAAEGPSNGGLLMDEDLLQYYEFLADKGEVHAQKTLVKTPEQNTIGRSSPASRDSA